MGGIKQNGLGFSWSEGWGVPVKIPACRPFWTEGGSFHQLAWTFYIPAVNRDMEYFSKVHTRAHTPEINWEPWFIYSSKSWLNCIFFCSRTINSFPFSDWIHKSKEHISWTNCDYKTPILHLLIPKTWFTMHSFLHCIRLELLFFTSPWLEPSLALELSVYPGAFERS